MMNAMNITGTMTGMGVPLFWLHAHFILSITAIIGGILFTIWAVRTLKGNALLTTAIWITTIGVIGTLITAPLGASAWILMMGGRYDKSGSGTCPMQSEMMKSMMDMMMEHNEDEDDDHEGGMGGMMDMNQPSQMMDQ